MSIWSKTLAGLLMAFLVAGIAPAPLHVHAQQNTAKPSSQSALAVSPAIIEQITPVGQSKTVTVQVTNSTAFPLPISTRVKNFVPLEQIEDTKDTAKYDASTWFTVIDPDFILQPKETRKVTVTVNPPDGAEPGGHYATVFFTPLIPDTALSPSTAYLSAQVGTLAFLVVPGKLTERLSVSFFSTAHIHQSRTVDFSVRLKNSGSVHLAPNARITISNWRGKTVASLPVNEGVVLPGTEKTSTVQWHGGASVGKYTAAFTAQYGAARTGTAPITVSFWVFPWGLVLAVCIPLGGGILLYFKTRGRWKHAWRILINRQDN